MDEKPTRVSIIDADLSLSQLLPIVFRVVVAFLISLLGIAAAGGGVFIILMVIYSLFRSVAG